MSARTIPSLLNRASPSLFERFFLGLPIYLDLDKSAVDFSRKAPSLFSSGFMARSGLRPSPQRDFPEGRLKALTAMIMAALVVQRVEHPFGRQARGLVADELDAPKLLEDAGRDLGGAHRAGVDPGDGLDGGERRRFPRRPGPLFRRSFSGKYRRTHS